MASFFRYKDLDLGFEINPITKDISKKNDENAIRQSVKNLIFYNFYEKWNPEIGSNVRNLLFDPMTIVTSTNIQKAIEQTIINFEPRVELIEVRVNSQSGSNFYNITIIFNIVNVENPIELNFLLEQRR